MSILTRFPRLPGVIPLPRSAPRLRGVLGVAALALAVTGCAEATDGTAQSPSTQIAPTDAMSAPATEQQRTIELQVAGGQVTPPPSQVDLAVGETLRLVVTSDRDSEIHAHGFEVDAPVPAGQPTTVELTGTAPGVYEVELHDPDLLLLQVAVR